MQLLRLGVILVAMVQDRYVARARIEVLKDAQLPFRIYIRSAFLLSPEGQPLLVPLADRCQVRWAGYRCPIRWVADQQDLRGLK